MAGFPWPLDGIQKWFESLWNWVSTAARDAVSVVSSWIWNAIYWVHDRVGEGFQWIGTYVHDTSMWLYSQMTNLFYWMGDCVHAMLDQLRTQINATINVGLGDLWTAIDTTIGNATSTVSRSVTDLWSSLTGLAGDLLGGMASALGGALLEAYNTMLKVGSPLYALVDTIPRLITDGMTGFGKWFWDSLKSLAEYIAGLMGAVQTLIKPVLDPIIRVIMDTATAAISPGSPPKEIAQASEAFSHALLKKMDSLMPKERSSPPALPILLAAGAGVVGLSMLTTFGMDSIATYLDLAHPVKMTGIMTTASDLLYSLNWPSVIGPIIFSNVYAALLLPLRYRWNEMYVPSVPDAGDLTRFANERLIGMSVYYENMRYQGYGEGWSDKFLQASWRVPAFREMQEMVWRGKITMEALAGGLRAMGTREDFIPGYQAIVDQVPNYGDMIEIYVREGYLEEYQKEIPAGMLESFKLIGYNEKWAKMLWGKHWVLPSVGQVFEMLHRDVIDSPTMSTYLKTADILAVWRDRLIKISWDLPGRIDARWMAGWGIIDVSEYGELLVKRGLDPDWRGRVAEATIKQQLASEINKIRDNAKSDYGKGYILEGTLIADLTELGFSEDRINYHMADAKADRERAHKDRLLGIYDDAYQKDLKTEDELAEDAAKIIVDKEALNLFLTEAYIRKYKKAKAG